jgi:hypothetical protein
MVYLLKMMISHSNVSHNQRVYSRTKVPVFSRDSLPPFCGAEQLRSAEAGTMDAYLPNRGDQGGSSPFVFTIKVEKKQETCGKIVIDIVMLYDFIVIPNGKPRKIGVKCLWSFHSLRTGFHTIS